MALDLLSSNTYHIKHSVLDFGTPKIFHTRRKYESSSFFHCRVIVDAFAFDAHFGITGFDVFGCVESGAGPWDIQE